MTFRRLAATSAVIAVSAALLPASAGAATPKGHLPLAFEATCAGLGAVASSASRVALPGRSAEIG